MHWLVPIIKFLHFDGLSGQTEDIVAYNLYEGWGLSHGIIVFLARLIDYAETWKYKNRSGWC
jgi:hypothetical protein